MNPDQILGFIVGVLVATGIFMAYTRSDIDETEPLCPHGDDWEYCPDCCH